MNIFDFLKSIEKLIFGRRTRLLEVRLLPSQGLFYKNDFEIIIKAADQIDIDDYEKNYIKDDIGTIIYYIKKIVERNIVLKNGYKYDDIKSIDIIFIFLEIVKLTKRKSIKLKYFDVSKNKEDIIEFGSKYFNYFQLGELIKYYDYDEKNFHINGYKYTLPSIGIENSLTNFLIIKSEEPDASKYNHYFYDFTYFVGDKNYLNYSEIENLLQIFNYDIDKYEFEKIKEIINEFSLIQRYSLIKDGNVIELHSKIDLEKIWK
jgi:hypothetical protein